MDVEHTVREILEVKRMMYERKSRQEVQEYINNCISKKKEPVAINFNEKEAVYSVGGKQPLYCSSVLAATSVLRKA